MMPLAPDGIAAAGTPEAPPFLTYSVLTAPG
jgi:hypothetical protein